MKKTTQLSASPDSSYPAPAEDDTEAEWHMGEQRLHVLSYNFIHARMDTIKIHKVLA